jgi:CheY-like chemotaxis protein
MNKRNTFNIMMIEDDPAHTEIVGRKLKDFPVANRFFPVKDGRQALDILFRKSAGADSEAVPRPDLILLDMCLPKVDGLEVLRLIKNDETLKQIPAIMLTTSDDAADIEAAYVGGAGSYLIKPATFEKFDKLLDALCSYWLTWNRTSGRNGI